MYEIDSIRIFSGDMPKQEGRTSRLTKYNAMQFRFVEEIGRPLFLTIWENENYKMFHRFYDNCEVEDTDYEGEELISGAAIEKAVKEGKLEHKWLYFCTCPLLDDKGEIIRIKDEATGQNKPIYKWDGRMRIQKTEHPMPLGKEDEVFYRVDKNGKPFNGKIELVTHHSPTYVERWSEEDDKWKCPAGLTPEEVLERDRRSMFKPYEPEDDDDDDKDDSKDDKD